MTAYLVALLKVTDPEGYELYKELVPATFEKYGGKYLARGGRYEVIEGDLDVNRVVVAEFESIERAKEWHSSPEYAQAKVHRLKSAVGSLAVVEGL